MLVSRVVKQDPGSFVLYEKKNTSLRLVDECLELLRSSNDSLRKSVTLEMISCIINDSPQVMQIVKDRVGNSEDEENILADLIKKEM